MFLLSYSFDQSSPFLLELPLLSLDINPSTSKNCDSSFEVISMISVNVVALQMDYC